jgi:hypothetical protein
VGIQPVVELVVETGQRSDQDVALRLVVRRCEPALPGGFQENLPDVPPEAVLLTCRPKELDDVRPSIVVRPPRATEPGFGGIDQGLPVGGFDDVGQ